MLSLLENGTFHFINEKNKIIGRAIAAEIVKIMVLLN